MDKIMKAGISTATLFCKQYNEETVQLFHEWRVPVAEVFLTSFCEYSTNFTSTLIPLKGDMEIFSVHPLGTQFEPQLYSAHPRVRKDAYRTLEDFLFSARLLGAKCYSFHGLSRQKRTFAENLPRTGEQTLRIAQACEQYGVSLCLENVEWAYYNRPDVFRETKRACPILKGVLDLKQARISGYSYREYLNEMGADITHVHVSDLDADGKMCLPGKGTFDFVSLVKELKDVGFDGPIFIENYQNDFESLGELKRSYEYLSEIVYKHG